MKKKMTAKEFHQLREYWYKKVTETFDQEDVEYIYTYVDNLKQPQFNPNCNLIPAKRVVAIDQLINNCIFVAEMTENEYKYLDALRFSGNLKTAAKDAQINYYYGVRIIQKWDKTIKTYQQRLLRDSSEDKLDEGEIRYDYI